jgi:hypothetical protein
MSVMFELLSQSWWEPNSQGQVDVGDLAVILAFIVAVIGAVTGLGRWWLKQLRKTIKEEVIEYTKPIQPTANGGYSLPDISRRVEKLEYTLADLKEDIKRSEGMITDLHQDNRETWGLLLKNLIKDD